MDEREQRLEEMLRKGPRPSPPDGLNRAIKDEIPDVIGSAGAQHVSSRGQMWLLAATLVLMVGAGWVAYRLIGTRQPQPSSQIAESPSPGADERPMVMAEKRDAPEELDEAPSRAEAVAQSVESPGPDEEHFVAVEPQAGPPSPAPSTVAVRQTDTGMSAELADAEPARARRETKATTETEEVAPVASPPPAPPVPRTAITVTSPAPLGSVPKRTKEEGFDQTTEVLSYEQIRDLLLAGEIPDRAAVDIETLINQFDYGDRPPWRRGKISVVLEGGAAPFRPGRWRTIRVGVRSAATDGIIGSESRLVLTFDPAAVALYRKVGHATTIDPAEQASVAVELGEIRSDQSRSFLYEVKLLSEIDLDQTVASASLHYTRTDGNEVAISRGLKSGHIAPTWNTSNTSLRLATLVAAWGETLRSEARRINPVELIVHARELEEAPDADDRVRELRRLIEQTAKLFAARRR